MLTEVAPCAALQVPAAQELHEDLPALLYLPAEHTPEMPCGGEVVLQNMPALQMMQLEPDVQLPPVALGNKV